MAINLGAIVQLLANQNPQMKAIMDQIQGMASAGQNPQVIIDAISQQYPQLQQNKILQNMRGKTPEEIAQYGSNLANTLGIFKQ